MLREFKSRPGFWDVTVLPGYIATLQRSGQSEAFSEWFTKEFQQARLSLVTDKDDEKGGATSSTQ